MITESEAVEVKKTLAEEVKKMAEAIAREYHYRGASIKLGVSQTSIWRWQKGEIPSAENLEKLRALYKEITQKRE